MKSQRGYVYDKHKPTTQTAMIEDHLLREKSITSVEAWTLYKARSLTKRIHELRSKGYRITSEWRKDNTGQRYVRYWLVSKEPVKVKPVFEYSQRLLDSVTPDELVSVLEGRVDRIGYAFLFDSTHQGHSYWYDKIEDEGVHLTSEDREYLVGLLDAFKAQFSDELLASVVPHVLKAIIKDWWNGESVAYDKLIFAFSWGYTAQGYEHWRDVKNKRVMTWNDYQYLSNLLWAKTGKGDVE